MNSRSFPFFSPLLSSHFATTVSYHLLSCFFFVVRLLVWRFSHGYNRDNAMMLRGLACSEKDPTGVLRMFSTGQWKISFAFSEKDPTGVLRIFSTGHSYVIACGSYVIACSTTTVAEASIVMNYVVSFQYGSNGINKSNCLIISFLILYRQNYHSLDKSRYLIEKTAHLLIVEFHLNTYTQQKVNKIANKVGSNQW